MDSLKSEWLKDHIRENHRYTLKNDQNHIAWNEIGVAYMNLGRISCAKKPLLKALKLQPRNSDYWFNVGLLYDKKGKQDLALRLYKRSLELNPKNNYPLYNLSIYYLESGSIEKAVYIWERLVKEHPYDFSAFARLADYFSENHEFSKVIELLEQFRANIQQDYAALWFIAEKYYEIDEYQLAKKILMQLFNHDSKYFDFAYTLAEIFLKENNYSEALFYLEKAILVEPFNQEVQFQRLLLKATLDCSDFLEVLEQTIHIHPRIALLTLEDRVFSTYHSSPIYRKIIKQARKREKTLNKLVFVDGNRFCNNHYLGRMHYKQLNIIYNYLRLLGFSYIVFFFDGISHYELELYSGYYKEFFSQGIIQEVKPNNSSIYRMLPIIAQITNGIIISNEEFFKYTKDQSIKHYLKNNQITYSINNDDLILKSKFFSLDEEYYRKVLYKSINDLYDEE
ncbi:MAG: tetratricopeptide repeat protein [Candidatus Heimdallarchaeota archaeon]|nr:tetratricopeptide repeat protein [Candidatus Heimdallarchaeota archaeon]